MTVGDAGIKTDSFSSQMAFPSTVPIVGARAAVTVANGNDGNASLAAPAASASERPSLEHSSSKLGSIVMRKISGMLSGDDTLLGVGARRGVDLQKISELGDEGASTPPTGAWAPQGVLSLVRGISQKRASQRRKNTSAAAGAPLSPHTPHSKAAVRLKRGRGAKGKRIYGLANRALKMKARASEHKVLAALLRINVSFLPKQPLKRLNLLNRRIRWLQVRAARNRADIFLGVQTEPPLSDDGLLWLAAAGAGRARP